MKEKKSNIGKYLLILVPFVMGVTGFTVLDGQPVVDSLFLSMEMYFLNYSDSPPNILIEIARWTAQRSICGHTVYLKSENLAAEGILDPHLRLFCLEETAARLYWRRNCLYETSCVQRASLQIVFLGFSF